MPPNRWKIFMAVCFTLMVATLLSACSLASSSPTLIPTPTAIPSQAPTLIPPTATVPSPTPQVVPDVSLRTFQMVDAQNGWGASAKMTLRTVDGGKTWQNVTPQDVPADIEPVFQVTAISPLAAWMIVPDPSDFKKGTLYRTADGGQTWQSSAVPFGSSRIQFQDDKKYAVLMASRGVAAGSEGVDLYQTSDGGVTWDLISRADPENSSDQTIPFGGNKSGVAFIDSTHGWVTGFMPMDGEVYMYATQDVGKTWKPVQLSLPAGWNQAQIESQPPVFFGGQDGIMILRASTNVGQMVLFVTHNGGDTWQATTPLDAYGFVSIPDAKNAIVWDGAKLHYSQDAGQTWQDRTPNVDLSQGLIALQFVDPNTGWALSQNGDGARLYSTTDGGSTWH